MVSTPGFAGARTLAGVLPPDRESRALRRGSYWVRVEGVAASSTDRLAPLAVTALAAGTDLQRIVDAETG